MADELAAQGLYLDEYNRLTILASAVTNQTNSLIESNRKLNANLKALERNIDIFIDVLEKCGRNVEMEKMAAIGVRNALKSVNRDREERKIRLQGLLMEKTIELERLQLEYHTLQLLEVEQEETIEHLGEMQ